MEPKVSIIIPVLNEASLLDRCLQSISGMDYPKDRLEVIIADGMSEDGSADIARKHGAIVVKNPKRTVSPGRNIAFKHATGEIIAFTDADCVVDSKWIRNALKYFDDPKVGCVGGPNLMPPDESNFGRAVGFVFNQGVFAAGSVHARVLSEVREAVSIPGCNAVYRKDALDTSMPISESLLTCDDTLLNRKILDNGYKLLYTPDVFVLHYRRPTPSGLFRQMYRYAIGRLQAGKSDRRMINVMHILTGLSIPIGLLILIASRGVFLVLLSVYVALILSYSAYCMVSTRHLKSAMRVPIVIAIINAGWSLGFMKELIFPLKRL